MGFEVIFYYLDFIKRHINWFKEREREKESGNWEETERERERERWIAGKNRENY